MKITIKATSLELSPALRQYIEEKISSLEKFIQRVGAKDDSFLKGSPSVEAWVEIKKTTEHHRKGDIFSAKARISLLGKSIRSEAIKDDLYLAINEVKDELQREFKQYTAEKAAKYKRGARKIKKDLHISPKARFYRKGRIREEGI